MSEMVPKVRFSSFTDDWEQRKLGEMMNVTSVKRIHQSDWTDSGIRFLRARDIVAAFKNEEPSENLYISIEKYNEYSKISGKVSSGDLLVTGVGSIGVPMLVTDEDPIYFKDGNIIWFKNESKIEGYFFYYSFINNRIQKYIRDVAGTGTVGTYTIDSGKKTPIVLPNYEEQEKIGLFFKQIDNLITLHQRKLDLLKKHKKGFLQKMFPKDGQLVPEVRFDGFTDDWEQRKLIEIVGSISDGDWIEADHIFDKGEYRIVQTGNIGVGEFIDKPKNAKFFHQHDFDDLHANEIFEGDILISRLSDPAGRTMILPYMAGRAVTSVDVAIIRPNSSFDAKFLETELNSTKMLSQVDSLSSGSTRKRISRRNLENIVLAVPILNEQEKIGVFFKQLDNLITLHQRKLDILKKQKKGFLQKMFVS